MKRSCAIILSAAVLVAVAAGAVTAEDKGSPLWYDPSVVPSSEEAVGDIKGIRGSIVALDGKEAGRVEVDESGITVYPGPAEEASPVAEEAAAVAPIHIPFARVRGVGLSYRPLPPDGRDWVFCARLTGGARVCLRARSREEVIKLADAVYTLALTSKSRICMVPLKLGVGVRDLTDEHRAMLGWDVEKGASGAKGAIMGDIFWDGPADKGGLKRLDIVTVVNGTLVADKAHFLALVKEAPAQGRIKLTVFRANDPEGFERALADPASKTGILGNIHNVFVDPSR